MSLLATLTEVRVSTTEERKSTSQEPLKVGGTNVCKQMPARDWLYALYLYRLFGSAFSSEAPQLCISAIAVGSEGGNSVSPPSLVWLWLSAHTTTPKSPYTQSRLYRLLGTQRLFLVVISLHVPVSSGAQE